MPRIAAGFARFLIGTASEHLLPVGIRWLHEVAKGFKDLAWKGGDLERNLMAALQVAWERLREAITADEDLHAAFLGLLNMLASRNSHAAIALRDRILSQTGHKP